MGLIPSSLLFIIGMGFLFKVQPQVLNDNILIQLKKIDSDVADKLNNIGQMVRVTCEKMLLNIDDVYRLIPI